MSDPDPTATRVDEGADEVVDEAPGGPRRAVRGPRAARGPGAGLAAALGLVLLLIAVVVWTRC